MPKRWNLLAQCALILTLASSLAVGQDTNNGRGGRGGGFGNGGPGGGGPGGGNRGGGPGGGGWGGPGGGGPTSISNLIQQEPVQDELKLTDKQKAQIKEVKENAEKKRTQVQAEANKVATAARQQAALEAAAAAEANGGTPFNNNGNTQNGGRGGQNGPGGRGGRNDAGAIASRQVMEAFQNQVEAAYLKTLDSKQKTRIKQIALQAEGAGAFNNPEVIEKLGMTMEQVQAIEAIRNDSRRSQGQIFRNLFAGNNNNNDNGNGGGRGRGGFPDPETMQSPEFQAKMKTAQDDQTKLEDQTMASVGKALTKAQRATFNKMIGEKFDVAALRQGMFNRFRPGGNNPPANGQQPPATTTPTPAPAANPTPAPATEATPKAPARKSLREQRGGSTGPN